MKIKAVRSLSDRTAVQAFLRSYIPASDEAEMMCYALNSEAKFVRVALDDRGVAGAVSYDIKESVYVYGLGSLRPGAGTFLMNFIEREARSRSLDVRLAAVVTAVPFYEKRGYLALERGRSIIDMIKPVE